MLVCAGKINRAGTIDQGNTVSDFHADEKEHQQSVHATVLTEEWLGRELNIIDCPGTPDFISEPLSALRVADSAMIVISGVNGVETGADELWAAAADYDIPRFLVINMLDRERTRFDEILEEARDHYGARVFPMSVPVDAGPDFRSVLDVMRSEVITFAADGSGKYEEKPAEGALKERVTELHRQLIDMVAESEDELLEKFFEEGTLTEEDLRAHVHAAVQKGLVVPVFAASAVKNVGVSRILDFIAKYGSSPVDRATVAATAADGSEVSVALDDGQTVAFVFKTMHEAHVGNLSFFRVYSGDVISGSELVNVNRGRNRARRPALSRQRIRPRAGGLAACRRYRRGGQIAGHPRGRHAVQLRATGDPAGGRVPCTQHPRRAGREIPGRPQQARRGTIRPA
jgi:elongation factor G